jgi:hypothetical protein
VTGELRGPGGEPLPLTVMGRAGRTATFRADPGDWATIAAAGLLHTERGGAGGALDADAPVEIEAELDPSVALDDPAAADESSWWARSATQAVELPPDLAGEGVLRAGVAYGAVPWEDLDVAWDASADDEPLLSLVTDVFAEQGWVVERPDPDRTVLQVPVPDDDGIELWVRTAEAVELVTIFGIVRAEVPGDRVADVLELAARLNEGVAVGSYEADADTGLLSFKTGIDVEGDRLSHALVGQMVGTAIVAAQRARPLLEGVLSGDHTPRGAADLL